MGTPLGRRLLNSEYDMLEQALDGVFGEHLLQIGRWGSTRGVLPFARTQRATTVYGPGERGHVAADFSQLPFDSDSVDAIVLPHTLDITAAPHDVLREVHRVLRSEGRLILLGFKPFGLWGVRRLWSRRRFPPCVNQVLGDRMLRDWMQLLDLRIEQHERFFFGMPFARMAGGPSSEWEALGRRWFPELAACYLVQARKRVTTLTPIVPRWRHRARVVGGVAEPTLRKVVRLMDVSKGEDQKDGT
ncbi:MAG: class I SAM-dependent methyltransferase [Pseudomonadota bacterium]